MPKALHGSFFTRPSILVRALSTEALGLHRFPSFKHFVTWPALLRLDFAQRTNDDCLHLSEGTGIVQGWTCHLAYWLREKARAHDSTGRLSASSW